MSATRPLRIAQVAPMIEPVPPTRAGGTERIVADLGMALAGLGHEITLFAAADSTVDLPRHGRQPSLTALIERHGEVAPGVPGALEAGLMADLHERLDTFDIVHCHTEFAHAAILGTARAHSLTTLHWRADELDRQLFFQRFPDLPIAAISARQARDVPACNLAGVVHHGLDPARFTPTSTPGRELVFIGRMTDQKRPDRAIEIARRCHRPLKLAGGIDPGNPDYFRRTIEKHLAPDIRHLGPLDETAKNRLFDDAAALLFPIDWPEPFGLVVIEAMARGVPVIAWPHGAVPELVEHGVTGFIVDSVAQAADAVAACDELDRGAIRARFMQRFCAERMARDYVSIYRRLLAQRSERPACE